MTPPVDAEIFEGSLSTFWFDKEGILYSKTKNVARTVDLIKENFLLVRKITNNTRVCLISEATDLPPLDKEASQYMASMLPHIFKAMAIISASDFGKLVANIFFSLQSHPIPTKMFATEAEAKAWIKQYR